MDETNVLKSKILMRLEADLGKPQVAGTRRILPVIDGRVSGPRIRGRLLPVGGDWMLKRPDGSFALDVRATVETSKGAIIYVQYGGRLVIPPNFLALSPEERAKSNPSDFYFRTTPLFETDAPEYMWLNDIVAVGVGKFTRKGVVYDVHEIQ